MDMNNLMILKWFSGGLLFICVYLNASAQDEPPTNAVSVTVTQSIRRAVEVTVEVLGDLESLAQPTIAAEISGQVMAINVDEGNPVKQGQTLAELDAKPYQLALAREQAEQQRLQALIKNQELTLERYQNLVQKNASAQSELDKAKTDSAVLQAELAGVQVRLEEAQYNLSKTVITSPVTGTIQRRLVSVGDYLQPGTPLFQIVTTTPLRARLYFPETLAAQIHLSLPVKLTIPEQTKLPVKAAITALRPMLDTRNRALEALAEFDNPGNWKPGYSIKAVVILERRPRAVMVPAGALVRRPAGTVVYRITHNHAKQQVVQTGQRDGEWIEILSGIAAGETIVLDGAGFLTDDVPVNVREKTS
ncbi:MAG: efflux RND transporter periplasmic adaptor subunit [Thioploca sp.]|nr:efflux RND transporter periplasmic adaptor subunit [Thioploca sp.]